jgi:transketolase
VDELCINAVRFLSVDAVQKANNGHPELPPPVGARLAVEAGVSQGWHRYVGSRGDVLAVDRFGASAPGEVMMRQYGFTVDNVCRRALALLEALA